LLPFVRRSAPPRDSFTFEENEKIRARAVPGTEINFALSRPPDAGI
jgi:hypothetical protein